MSQPHIDALELDYLPQHLIVIGGGYSGLELAQAFRRFGSDVTIIESGPQPLAREDIEKPSRRRRTIGAPGELDQEREWALLMGAAVDGDGASYRRLLDNLAAVLRHSVRRGCERARVGNADIEDIVQEILLAIHLKRHTWRREDPIGPWIAAISRNKLIDALRRRGRRVEVAVDDLLDTLPGQEESDASMAAHDLGRMLDHLSARRRDIVNAVSVEGHSMRETAERLKMSEGAVRVALHRALKTLTAIYRSARA